MRDLWARLRASIESSQTASETDDERLARVHEGVQRECETYNKSRGNLNEQDGYDCPKCLNRGYFMAVEFHNGYPYTPHTPCSCMKIRASIARMERSGLKDAIRRYRFDSFTTPEKWQQDMAETAREYAAACREGSTDKWLVMLGQPGCGKTHLCVATCRELLLQGNEVYYSLWREEMGALKRAMTDEVEYTKRMGKLQQVDVLYLDDLFKPVKGEGITPSDIKLTYDIINHRYVKRLRTLISGELFMDEMLDLDEATASRIAEMSKGFRVEIGRDKMRNWRMRNE